MPRFHIWIDKGVSKDVVINAGIESDKPLNNEERDKLCFELINKILSNEITVGWRQLSEDESWPSDISDKYGIRKIE